MTIFSALLRSNARWIALVAGLAFFAGTGNQVVEQQASSSGSPVRLVDGATHTTDDAHKGASTVRSVMRGSLGTVWRLGTERTRELIGSSSQPSGGIASSRASAQTRSWLFYVAHLTLVECGSLSARTTSLPPPINA
jgi:hypothetical protein